MYKIRSNYEEELGLKEINLHLVWQKDIQEIECDRGK